MKRSILFSALGVAAIAAAVAGHSMYASTQARTMRVADGGIACTTTLGHSGYMVATGRGPECQEDPSNPGI